MPYDPSKSCVTSEELNEPIRRPTFKKRQPTGANMVPLPGQIGVTKGKNAHGTVSREDGFSEGDVGDMAQSIGESVSGMDAHLVQMAMESGDDDVYNDVINIL